MSDPSNDVAWLGDAGALRFPASDDPWGRKGWAAYFSDIVEDAGALVFVRMGLAGNAEWESIAPTDRAPLVLHELYTRVGAGGATATTDLVRGIPLARMEAAANLRLIRQAERPGKGDYPFLNSDESTQAPRLLESALWPWAQRPDKPARVRRPSLKLRAPATGRKPDSFYEQVAELFLYLSSQGNRPAEELAAANDVPVTTTHRWVKEARRRGILYPGARGKGYA